MNRNITPTRNHAATRIKLALVFLTVLAYLPQGALAGLNTGSVNRKTVGIETTGPTARLNRNAAAAYDCEGNACSQVTLTWDNENQQFSVRNDSGQTVKVEVSTFAGLSHVIIPAHEIGYLTVKTFNGSYHANFV